MTESDADAFNLVDVYHYSSHHFTFTALEISSTMSQEPEHAAHASTHSSELETGAPAARSESHAPPQQPLESEIKVFSAPVASTSTITSPIEGESSTTQRTSFSS